jgi:hypothetical protein
MVRRHAGWAIRALFALGFCICTAQRIDAECLISTPNGGGGGTFATPTSPAGQSFVACQNGFITNVAIWVGVSTQPVVTLGLQAGIDLLAPEYTATKVIPTGADRIRFTPMFPVTQGSVYSLSLTPASGSLSFAELPGSSYTEGSRIAVVGGQSVPLNTDIVFAVTITDGSVPSAAATWGKIKSIYR